MLKKLSLKNFKYPYKVSKIVDSIDKPVQILNIY